MDQVRICSPSRGNRIKKIFSAAFLCSWLIAGPVLAENLSGEYTLSVQGTTLTLTLDQDTQGKIKGTLSSTTGMQFRVEGAVQDNVGVGTCISNQGGSYFEARPKGDKLLFALIEAGPNNMPDYSKVRKLTFKKEEGAALGQQGPQALPKAARGTTVGVFNSCIGNERSGCFVRGRGQ